MQDVNFAQVVTALNDAGLSNQKIADTVGTSKGNVNQIKNHGTEPKWTVGNNLLALLRSQDSKSALLPKSSPRLRPAA